ncbi:Inner membrane protein oxaA [Zea mays]|uniref:Inner membrane protein oxaA n=1 Tax=Zea mays TaxID=4577 RepID=A0A1D6FTL0_MAIZE|nr:Inner membrane protein oxaA [Zea mays]
MHSLSISCPVCYLPVEQALALRPAKPSLSPVLQSLNYVLEEILIPKESKSGSLFGGFPSLEERDKSYDIKDSMTVHCGFVRGKVPGINTGFDIDEADHSEMQLCQSTVVASAIFGNYDVMQQPENISKFSKDTVCFFMFLDELIELVGRKQFNCKCWRFCSYTTAYLTDSIPTLFYYL